MSTEKSLKTPIVIPRQIKLVRCSIVKCSKHLSPHSEAYVSSAVKFLTSIESNKADLASLRVKKLESSYRQCLHDCNRPVISVDLQHYPSKLDPGALKEKFNLEFAKKYPSLDPKLTLSKIVHLRKRLFSLGGIDPYVISLAWFYFMQLLQLNLVRKESRFVYSAVCGLIAFKFVEEPDKNQLKKAINVLKSIDPRKGLRKKVIVKKEFMVYSQLNFGLYVDNHTLAQACPKEYLGEFK